MRSHTLPSYSACRLQLLSRVLLESVIVDGQLFVRQEVLDRGVRHDPVTRIVRVRATEPVREDLAGVSPHSHPRDPWQCGEHRVASAEAAHLAVAVNAAYFFLNGHDRTTIAAPLTLANVRQVRLPELHPFRYDPLPIGWPV